MPDIFGVMLDEIFGDRKDKNKGKIQRLSVMVDKRYLAL